MKKVGLAVNKNISNIISSSSNNGGNSNIKRNFSSKVTRALDISRLVTLSFLLDGKKIVINFETENDVLMFCKNNPNFLTFSG